MREKLEKIRVSQEDELRKMEQKVEREIRRKVHEKVVQLEKVIKQEIDSFNEQRVELMKRDHVIIRLVPIIISQEQSVIDIRKSLELLVKQDKMAQKKK